MSSTFHKALAMWRLRVTRQWRNVTDVFDDMVLVYDEWDGKKSHLVFPNIALMFLVTRHTNPDWTFVIRARCDGALSWPDLDLDFDLGLDFDLEQPPAVVSN